MFAKSRFTPFVQRPLGVLAAALLAFIASGAFARPALADEALVAVAANFADVVRQLTPKFTEKTGHRVTVAVGSTGKLYAQILNGAPFDVLLAADQGRPKLLEENGGAVTGSRFTYAVGQLSLWSADPGRVAPDAILAQILTAEDVRHIAIANPELAPYGAAARQVLQSLGLWERLSQKIVMTENIGQAFAAVATGNAELGFVALSAVLSPGNEQEGSRLDVPIELYGPIAQDAVLLERGKGNEAAIAFLDFLKSPEARTLIERFGYGVE